MDVTETNLFCIPFQILDEGPRRERRAGPPRTVVARPQGALRFDDVHPARRLKVVLQRHVGGRVRDLACGELPTLTPVLDDKSSVIELKVFTSQADDLTP